MRNRSSWLISSWLIANGFIIRKIVPIAIFGVLILFGGVHWFTNYQRMMNDVGELKETRKVLQKQVNDQQDQQEKFGLTKDLLVLEKDRITLESTLTNGAVQAIGGLLLFFTAFISWQNLKATQRNVLVAEEKQVTERFTQAINQLGSDKIEIRFGGIYALERIARDSEKDHWTIMEVLSSFIQEKSPLSKSEEQNAGKPEVKKIPKDVQAALTVIRRRESGRDEHGGIDLAFAKLNGAELNRANLSGANLLIADLSNADLNGAELVGAKLVGANLSGADLSDANLNGASLLGARLMGANLLRAKLMGAKLNGANLSNTSLFRANLSDANLSGADLSDADLRGAKLTPLQVKQAQNFETAEYDDNFRQQLDLPPK
jgi:uncharacterized protein YjbI with pentapeptide repeats